MKNYITYLFIAIAFLACDNDDDNAGNPLDLLPPITTTGENTIGCLVNGEAFTDSGLMNNFYQFVDGNYFLAINMNFNNGKLSKNLRIQFRRLEIDENQTYTLDKNDLDDGDFTGAKGQYTYSEDFSQGGLQFDTNMEFIGQVIFTKLDTNANIMSGTFEFQAKEITSGEIITITNGRFDLTFTK